jgi:starch synthase
MSGRRSIVHVASEMAPLVKVGGLGDVVGALSSEQARRGHRVTVAIPAYRTLQIPRDWKRRPLEDCDVPWGLSREPATFELCCPEAGPRVLLVGHAGDRQFFDRAGVYDDPKSGEGYADNAERFLFFSRAALEGLLQLGDPVDVLHAHDHQAAWTTCLARIHEPYAKAFHDTATVFTVHNLGYQGIHDPWVLGLVGIGSELFYPSGPFEFWGRVNYMKVGLAFADMISTVSPRYAQEIQSNGEFGCGLEGVLARRQRDLRGILNGIDDALWDPARDVHLPHRYDLDQIEKKMMDTRLLARECGFPREPAWPLIGMISRLTEQKGFDLIEQARQELARLDARFVVLGTGQPRYQDLLRRLAVDYPTRFHYCAGHDEALAHRIEGGCNLFLMPSRYEPCGLNQMYSLRYGTPPVVRAVGGLVDTVEEFDPLTGQGNGFLFQRFDADEMLGALRRTLAIYRQPALWRTLQRNGMTRDFSWRRSADLYDELYEEARERVASGRTITLETARSMI